MRVHLSTLNLRILTADQVPGGQARGVIASRPYPRYQGMRWNPEPEDEQVPPVLATPYGLKTGSCVVILSILIHCTFSQGSGDACKPGYIWHWIPISSECAAARLAMQTAESAAQVTFS